MRYREYPPAGVLAPYVACFWELASRGEPYRVLPDGAMDIVYVVGERRARVIGPMTRALVTATGVAAAVVGVRFRPGAAIRPRRSRSDGPLPRLRGSSAQSDPSAAT